MKYLNDVSYKDCVGKVCKSKLSGDFKILKYNDAYNVDVQFLKTGFETRAQLGNIRNGEVKDPYSPSVYGVGVLGTRHQSTINGRNIKEYEIWYSMLQRCYSDTFKKHRPTYGGCEVSDNFKSYEYFYEWCQKQIGFGNEGWQLDKDLLVKGNKVYSESACVFLPQEVNSLLIKHESSRGKHPIGVTWCKRDKVFVAQINKNKGKHERLGSFKTELEAFNAYKKAKEKCLKEYADKFKDVIDEKVYEALYSYSVEITD